MEISEIVNQMHEEGIESLLIFKPENITYLSGYWPTSTSILLLKDDPVLLVPKLDLKEAEETSALEVDELRSLPKLKKTLPVHLGVEPSLDIATYKKIDEEFKIQVTDLVERSRIIKSEGEVHNIQKAIEIAEKSFLEVEMRGSEDEAAARLEYIMRLNGSSKPAFNTIMASGRRSSFPHASTSPENIESPLVIDWGAVYNHYASDTSRTLVETEKEEEIFDIVLEAQEKAIKNIKPGVKASYIDKVARDIITDYGYGESFLHSTGHGVGLEVHEMPSLSSKEDKKLEAGMVITVEPGIYVEGEFGVRVEDMVLVGKRSRVLNNIDSRLSF
ncbi:MAG: aminopeptidase P family protein [Euryarchaeota archaeon]|jgi:Xaa-Pro dipeptidase|nr:aminopeptidase P family protein [Euryarchaeota archaeon]